MSPLRPLVAAALCLVGATSAHATAIFAVGTGAGCGYSSIQQAVDAERAYAGPNDIIYVSRTLSYSAQAIYVHDQSLTIIGGVDNCNDYTPSGWTTISGSGGAAASVITLRGTTNLRLSYLIVTQGDDTSDNVGGGIDFQGQGKVQIDNSRIFNNKAGYGAGINFNGTGAGGELDLETETLVSANTASVSGGGVRMEGKSQLRILQPETWIANNHADNGYGGGLLVIGPAFADLASPGYLGDGLLYLNTAKFGGGVSVISPASGQNATVRLFTTDPLHPVGIEGNSASVSGGGIYLQGYQGSTLGFSTVCGTDYRINDNSAPEGSAIYESDFVSSAYLNRPETYTGCSLPLDATQLGARPCTSKDCNLIDGNVAQNTSGQATAGSAIAMVSSYFNADRLRLSGNRGAHAIHWISNSGSTTYLRNCLIDGNVLTSDLIASDTNSSPAYLTNCTLAGNQIGSGVVLRTRYRLSVQNSIIYQPGTTVLVYSGSNPVSDLQLDYILAHETASMAPSQGTNLTQGIPQLVDAPNGDYRLRPNSPAIDRAPAVTGDDRDLDDRPYDQDIGSVPNGDGVRDLGAYERQVRYCGATDTLFCDNFAFD